MSDAMEIDSAAAGAAQLPARSRKRFEIKKWTAVAFWSWDQKNEYCAICRSILMDACIDCANANAPGPKRCPRAVGLCAHSFHFHCITQWIATRNSCPLDNKPWEMKEVDDTV